ncbi:extradiol dioxygenase family protein [Natronospira proteinivora]|uniref:Extradiol dioxygenase family protein n=1 Tax=Natronospira proteinivora TaxID=1807133 RepID=A0ABT1GAA1_9GAMM|nr:VOC family protein [Natronospira proteinivora]MCP1728254.1 extradiol dioxygenase family protein [Natronospira proteinivora]
MSDANGTIPFHLAFPVRDIESTRRFYGEILDCAIGREAERWIDFDFFGHQLSAHVAEERGETARNEVDGDAVPVRHFGAVLPWPRWEALADKLRQHDVPFLIAPRIRFQGEPGEQGTFFIKDPSGNALEFKSFRHPERLFSTQ